LIFDYTSSLTGTGNRSFVDSSDIIDFSFIISYSFDGYRGLGLHPFFYNFALLCFRAVSPVNEQPILLVHTSSAQSIMTGWPSSCSVTALQAAHVWRRRRTKQAKTDSVRVVQHCVLRTPEQTMTERERRRHVARETIKNSSSSTRHWSPASGGAHEQ